MDSTPSPSGLLAPEALAAELEQILGKLTEALGGLDDRAAQELLEACPAGLEQACGALRGMADAFEASHQTTLTRKEQELGFVVDGITEGLHDLGEANRSIAAKVRDQARELDAIDELPPGEQAATRLRGVAVRMQEATDEMERCLAATAAHVERAAEQVAALQAEVEAASRPRLYDPDTRLYSRAALEERLRAVTAAGQAYGGWRILLAGIDGLSAITERFGPLVGDALIFKIARIIEERLQEARPNAFLARFDGDEFAIVLRSPLAGALELAERVRQDVASARWQPRGRKEGGVLETTISIGAAPCCRGDTVATLLERAERAIRSARQQGGNAVVSVDS
jgi:diguanylate cyclase (GGDEF)-like protein